MANNKLANLKSQLLTSGLSARDQPLFQVISQLIQFLQDLGYEVTASASSGGSGNGITGLSGDVVASGPGNVAATIQPNVVAYGKMQQVAALRLLGNATAVLADVMEIGLGDNLEFDGTTLNVTIPGSGGTGLGHRVLSSTHIDSIPALAQAGDLIYATNGADITGDYYSFILNAPVVEDFSGLRFGYYAGYHGAFTPTNSMGYCPEDLDFIPVVPPDTWLSWDFLDFYILALVIEDFVGLRLGYVFTADPVTSNYYAYYPPGLAFVDPPSPENEATSALWTRRGIGTEGQVLTSVDGFPVWQDLPAEPEFPWEDIPFVAGNFTATGGTTPDWTVASGDVERWQRQDFPGNNVRIALYVRATTVSGTAPTQLVITLPFSITGRFAQFISIQENGAVANGVFVEYDSGTSANQLFLNKIGGAVFDTTAAGTFLAFEISATLA